MKICHRCKKEVIGKRRKVHDACIVIGRRKTRNRYQKMFKSITKKVYREGKKSTGPTVSIERKVTSINRDLDRRFKSKVKTIEPKYEPFYR